MRPLWSRAPNYPLWDPIVTRDASRVAARIVMMPPGMSSLAILDGKSGAVSVVSPTSQATPISWSSDGKWIYTEELAGDDRRLRLVAVSAAGDGRSRLLAVPGNGLEPRFIRNDSEVLWLAHEESTDIFLATLDPRPPLPIGPPSPPAPAPVPPAMQPSPTNLVLAGSDGGPPTSWNVAGEPAAAHITNDCGRKGSCVVLDGTSKAQLFQAIDATPYRGRRIRVSFDVRVERANCFVVVDSGLGYARSTIPSGQLEIPDQRWERRELTADVAPDAVYIELRAVATQSGTAWVANFALELMP
jgi:hypothetical protein